MKITIGSPLFMLFLVFLILKLCNVIAWDWLWVLSPLWIPFAIVFVILFLGGIVFFIHWLFTKKGRKVRRKGWNWTFWIGDKK